MPRTQTSAQEVAQYLIWLAAHERPDEPGYLTNMDINKLLFYVQGWTMAEWNAPMFRESIEAWPRGPVVPEVWRTFHHFGDRPVVQEHLIEPTLHETETRMIREVWDVYKGYSTFTLSDMTHEELPFIEARGDLSATQRSHRKIRVDTIGLWFQRKLEDVEKRLSRKWDQLTEKAKANCLALTGQPTL